MRLGITGPAYPPEWAKRYIHQTLLTLPAGTIVVTGGCIGVDALAARYAKGIGYEVHTVLPQNKSRVDPEWRDYCDTWEEVRGDYRARNTRLVAVIDRLWAYPLHASDGRDIGSGTWMTIRIARRVRTPVDVYQLDLVAPDGARIVTKGPT